ncbi:MAG: adenylate/guanylate cyclase domain-containing protein, partial [Bacteroidota bacterium]
MRIFFLIVVFSVVLVSALDAQSSDKKSGIVEEQLSEFSRIEKDLERAVFYRGIGEFKEAKKIATKAYKDASKLDDARLQANALYEEAMALKAMGKHQYINKGLALSKFQKSLRLLEENDLDFDPLVSKNEAEIEYIIAFYEDTFDGSKEKVQDVKVKIDTTFRKDLEATMTALADELADLNINVVSNLNFPERENKPNNEEESDEFIESITSSAATAVTPTPATPPSTPERAVIPPPSVPATPKATVMWKEVDKLMALQKELARKDFFDNVKDEAGAINVKSPDLANFETLWPFEAQAIKNQLAKEEQKVESMAPENARNELLYAYFQQQYDSLMYLREKDSLMLAQNNLLLEKQEAELAAQQANKYLQLMTVASGVLMMIFLYWAYAKQKKNNRKLSQQNHLVLEEKKRSEDLLLNILPAEVAKELKAHGAASAHKYDNVSVLFSDFKNFSRLANKLSPVELVSELDYCFRHFDRIIEKYRLEKIKTIGDAYMCAGGLHTRTNEHLVRIISAALEMQQFLAKWKEERTAANAGFQKRCIGSGSFFFPF